MERGLNRILFNKGVIKTLLFFDINKFEHTHSEQFLERFSTAQTRLTAFTKYCLSVRKLQLFKCPTKGKCINRIMVCL